MTEPNLSREPAVRDCLIVVGGPAGMVLGLLLGRRGVRVQVLERQSCGRCASSRRDAPGTSWSSTG